MGATLVSRAGLDFSVAPSADAARIGDLPDDLRVIVLGPGVPRAEAFAIARSVSDTRPAAATLLVSNDSSAELLRQALRSGLTDVVAMPGGDLAELQAAFDAALERASRLHAPGAVQTLPHRGRLFTVLSTKGGVGKSVISCNVAVSLAELGKSTVLVDLDLKSGDVGIMLQLRPERTIADAAIECDHLDDEMLRGFVVDHPSGVHALLAPARPDDSSLVTAPRVNRILDLLLKMYDVVIVDTPPVIDDCVLTAVDKSTRVLLVSTVDVTSVKDARYGAQRLRSLGYSDDVTLLIVNRADSKVFLDPVEVERAVGLKIAARIPSDRVVPRCVNKGVPVVDEAPRSAVARSLREIAAVLARAGETS
jgi:pilus assembly protein CpaE